MMNDEQFRDELIKKIIKHAHTHEESCLHVCPMIINRYEMEVLKEYARSFMSEDLFKKTKYEDIKDFYGVRLYVID